MAQVTAGSNGPGPSIAMGAALKKKFGVPIVAQWLMNPTSNHEVVVSIPGLAQWVKDLALTCAVV